MPLDESFIVPRQLPVGEELEAVYARLMTYPNVVGRFLGKKQKDGVDRRGYAVVALVREKVRRDALSPRERLPAWITWQVTSTQTRRCRVDVQVIRDAELHAPVIAGPGDVVESIQESSASALALNGTVGGVLRHPELGIAFTTAGHALGRPFGTKLTFPPQGGPRISLRNGDGPNAGAPFEGVLAEFAWTAESDYALIKPGGVQTKNSFQDSFPLISIYTPQFFQVGTPLAALTRTGLKQLTYLGSEGSVPFGPFPAQTVHVAQMGPDPLRGGDSGCAVIDKFGRVWGFHLGAASIGNRPCSVFRAPSQDLGLRSSSLFI
jgi:hypothetical protein